VLKSRPKLLTTRYTVANYHYKKDPQGSWRIAVIEDEEVGKCTL
jgi:ketosteroid isomerase-like protein